MTDFGLFLLNHGDENGKNISVEQEGNHAGDKFDLPCCDGAKNGKKIKLKKGRIFA